MPEIGENAPNFCLPDKDGNKICLKDHKGKWVVFYFYPRDNTPGCTTEAIEFTGAKEAFEKEGAIIFGVSPDSQKSHCNFAEKHKLQINLLSDPEHLALEDYGAWQKKKNYGREYMGVVRSTFLIDPEGKLAHIWPKVRVKGHVDTVLEKLKESKKE